MSLSVLDVLEEIKAASSSDADRGARFERLIAAYLKADPAFADQFEDVWLWQDWPGRAGKHDTGIDLVARTREDGLVAIQCKFYDRNSTISKQDIDTFLSASGKYYSRGFSVCGRAGAQRDAWHGRPGYMS